MYKQEMAKIEQQNMAILKQLQEQASSY